MCKGSIKKRNTDISSITVRDVTSRSIEGLRRNGFLIFPTYFCNVCCTTKVATDTEALATMGVPLFILERCDFIFFHKCTWTRELMEFVNSLMIDLGALPIVNIIKKLRTENYLEDANVYLQAIDYERRSRSSGLHTHGFSVPQTDIQPFPGMNVHCGGYGSGNGLSDNNISVVYQAYNFNLKKFGDRCMESLGGNFISFDHTFKVAERSKDRDVNGNSHSPITALYADMYNIKMKGCQ
mmetsp:Transcript_15028/g.14393  ORF Transcript_15028/g.14393 Transcript_15028/m.14393 type:complete len:239 (+) Transcript_15028:946-1662(+)